LFHSKLAQTGGELVVVSHGPTRNLGMVVGRVTICDEPAHEKVGSGLVLTSATSLVDGPLSWG